MHSMNCFLPDRAQEVEESNPEFEALLNYLKHSRGCDLTSYKRPSLMRRFQHRMHSINIDTYQRYLQYLQCDSTEYQVLLNDVFINVTSFFRDQPAWNYLAAEVIPKLIAEPDASIRVWSAGCATGQEIYSLLMLLAEALGLEACLRRVRCFATDADEVALSQARRATYSSRETVGIPPELLEKYFEQTEKSYVFHPELRRTVIFSRHNLIQDTPISKTDLLVCRNVLIYLNPEAQTAILNRFHFALNNTGVLFLGQAEMLTNPKQSFVPINSRCRVYTKGLKSERNDYLFMVPKSRDQRVANVLPIQNRFWEAAFETSSCAHIAIDAKGCLLHANEQARSLFGLTFNDWKRPLQELEAAKLVSANTLTKALYSHQRLTPLKNVEWTTEEGTHYFDIDISRVLTAQNRLSGIVLTFIETKNYRQLAEELESTRSNLTRVSKILKETDAELSMVYKELESTQKELEVLQQERDFTHLDVQYCN